MSVSDSETDWASDSDSCLYDRADERLYPHREKAGKPGWFPQDSHSLRLSLPSGLELIGVRWSLCRYYNRQRGDRDRESRASSALQPDHHYIRNQRCLIHLISSPSFLSHSLSIFELKMQRIIYIPTWITKSHHKTFKSRCYFLYWDTIILLLIFWIRFYCAFSAFMLFLSFWFY